MVINIDGIYVQFVKNVNGMNIMNYHKKLIGKKDVMQPI